MEAEDWTVTILGIILGTIIMALYTTKGKQKEAIEVYKGNTKLQYTIVYSVKVDSCVIFLNK